MRRLTRRLIPLTLLFLGCAGGLVGWLVWQRLNDPVVVRATVEEMLAAALPGARIEVGAVSGNPLFELRVGALSVQAPLQDGSFEEVVRLGCVTLQPDRSELLEGRWRIKRIIFESPVLQLTQHEDNSWSIERWRRDTPIRFVHPCEVLIRDGRFRVTTANLNLPPVDVEGVNLTFNVKPQAEVQWTGSFAHETGEYKTEGTADFVRRIVRSTTTASVRVTRDVALRWLPAEKRRMVEEWTRTDASLEISAAGSASWSSGEVVTAGQVSARVLEGHLEHPRLPYPITEIAGDAIASDAGLEIRRLEWSLGPGRGALQATMEDWDPERFKGSGQMLRLPFSEEVFRVLPPLHQASWHRYRPEGSVDLSGWFKMDKGRPEIAITTTFRDNAFTFERFPYRIHGTAGKALISADGEVEVDITALAGDRPLSFSGSLSGLRPDAAYDFRLIIKDVPLDDRIEAALADTAREAYQKFAGNGSIDADARFTRREGDLEGTFAVDADLRCRTMRCSWFNYPLENVTGRLQFLPDRAVFRQVHGRSGPAIIKIDGSTARTTDGPHTELEIRAENVPIDQELQRALTGISPRWEANWNCIRPEGMINVDCRLVKPPDQPVDLQVGIDMSRAAVTPTAFPYHLERFEGRINHRDGRAFWDRLKFRHGSVMMECSGEIAPIDGGATLILKNLHCPAMPIDAAFRAAFPPEYRSTLEFLSPDTPIELRFSRLQAWWFHERELPPVIAFDGSFGLRRSRIIPSVGVSNVTGSVEMKARFNGPETRVEGTVALDTIKVAGFSATQVAASLSSEKGTFRLADMAGQFYEGTIHGDLKASTGGRPRFETRLTVKDGRLTPWVREISRNPPAVDGRVDAEVVLGGTVDGRVAFNGRGWLRISDADIVGVPLLQEFFRLVSLQVPTGRAFDDVDSQFRLEGRKLVVERLELTPRGIVGPSVSLFNDGPGEIDLDSMAIAMRMAIRYGKGKLRIPAFTPILNGAGDSFAKIKVGGTLYNPEPSVEAVPGLRRLLTSPFTANGGRNPPARR